MTTKQIEADAYTVANYMTLESIENELQDCRDVIANGDGYSSINDVIAVLEKARELMQ